MKIPDSIREQIMQSFMHGVYYSFAGPEWLANDCFHHGLRRLLNAQLSSPRMMGQFCQFHTSYSCPCAYNGLNPEDAKEHSLWVKKQYS